MKPILQITFGILLTVGAAFGPTLFKAGCENFKKQYDIGQLDAISLGILERINGLIFPGTKFDYNAMRHLMKLSLIQAEVFPSKPISFGYYLTEEGRVLLTSRLKKELYPESFCNLIRIRYWEGYPKEFLQKKERFKMKYGISWERSWEVFNQQVKKEKPNAKDDTLTIFNSYI